MIFGGTLALAEIVKRQESNYGLHKVKDCSCCHADMSLLLGEWLTDQAIKQGLHSSSDAGVGVGE